MSNGSSSDDAQRPTSRPLQFSGLNAGLAVAGLAAVAAGYWLLAEGSITTAPMLLVLGYVVLLPLAIIL